MLRAIPGRALLLAICMLVATRGQSSPVQPDDVRWIATSEGPIKGQVFRSQHVGSHPVLLVVIHGDFTNPPPVDQYDFAKGMAANTGDLIAAGLLRPGYVDAAGDRSAGRLGTLTGDNYTPEVVDAVAAAVRTLKEESGARAVVLFGHSGGAAIVADLLGRHPGLVDGAVLSACNCDLKSWRERYRARNPGLVMDDPNPSLMPMQMAARIPLSTRVRMIVGAKDENTIPADSQAYAALLAGRGIDVSLTIAPGLDHASMFATPVVAITKELIALF